MNGKNHNVIVADNDYFLAKVLQVKLKEAGFSVAVAHDNDELEKVSEGELPDVILLEVTSLGSRPVDVVSKIVVDGRFAKTCVCILTRVEDTETQKQFTDIGVDLYMKKTEVSFADIMARLTECVAKKKSDAKKDAA